MIKRLFGILLILLLLAVGTAVCQTEPALTLMVYLCGSNLETEASAASADLSEMMAHYPSDGSIRVIVMPSGSQAWHTDISTDETVIYELTGAGLEKLCTLPLQNMGDPATLTALLDFAYTHAPAQKYALLMWNHGAGPNVGLCFDELFPTESSMDGLTLQELSAALGSSFAARHKLSWIGFDACLMASVETACAVAPYADFMIASQETEPASGWDYRFLAHAAADASGAETGSRAIDAYFDSLSDSMSTRTLSCVALQDMPAISEMLDELFNSLHVTLDEASYPAFAACRVNTKSLGDSASYEYDLVDLVDLLQVYQAEGLADCSSLLSLLDQAIVESRTNTRFINGLSISYPHYGTQENISFPASAGYASFIADMSALRLGKPLTDWSETYRPEAALQNSVTHVTMALTPSQAATLDTATLFILKQMSGSDYQLVYRTNDVTLTEDHILTAAYEEQALFIVDAQGNAVSSALPYTLQGDAVVLNCMLTKDAEHVMDDNWYAFVRCLFRQDGQGRYHLAEVQESTADPTLQGKATVRLEDYTSISIFEGSSVPVYAEDGKPLPPIHWGKGDMSYGWWFDLADYPDWSVAFLSQQDSRSRYALLQMTDTQNQVICSELLPIPNPNLIDLPTVQQTLVDNDACRIRFTGAQEVQGEHPALRLHFSCENRDSRNIHVSVNLVQLDDAVLSRYDVTSPGIDPGEIKTFEIEASREELESLGIQSAERLRVGLSVSYDYTETFLKQTVEYSFTADLSSIAPAPVPPDILASAALDGVELGLYDLACEGDQYITGKLRIRNTTDAAVTLDVIGYYLNGLQLNGYLTNSLSSAPLPPGAIYHAGFRINLQAYDFDYYRPESTRLLLESLGMSQLHTLEISIYDTARKQSARVAFALPQPLALPVDETRQRADAWPVLYARDGVTIRLADLTWTPDAAYGAQQRYINLLVDNTTEEEVHIRVPWRMQEDSPHTFLVNGHSLDYVSSPIISANTMGMASLFYTAAEGYETVDRIEMQLHITDSSGRNDQLLVCVDALGEACADGDYRILEADQLQVTVTPMN